ncbi:MAG: LuxR family transcriptional regulator [Chromatiales bacterium]
MPSSRVSELIDTALRATSVDDIHSLASALCRQLGFESFIYGAQFPASLVRPEFVLISSYPQEWRQLYDEKGYMRIDPTVAHCKRRTTPLLWSDIRAGNPKIIDFMMAARDFGLVNGMSFPAHGGRGEAAMLSLASHTPRNSGAIFVEALPVAYLMTGYMHEAVLRVFDDTKLQHTQIKLTEREKECLLWTAEGKTSWEMSKILNISERTVIFHLKNCSDKLVTCNRQQAVAKAVSQGLISPRL